MRGHYVPFIRYATGKPLDARDEIRRAIDEVRFSEQPGRPGDTGMQRQPAMRQVSYVVPRFAFVSPIDHVDGNISVPIRGRVPLAFFRWFDELRSRLQDQQTMLTFCGFEEAD
ncbi:MAG: hypothetical protein KJ749_10140 [Planctomycetes bacterium]|nr:hypothetical protein [Planctomycetota bacterium]